MQSPVVSFEQSSSALAEKSSVQEMPVPGFPPWLGVSSRKGPLLQKEEKGGRQRERTAACSMGRIPKIARHIRTAGLDPECSELHYKSSSSLCNGAANETIVILRGPLYSKLSSKDILSLPFLIEKNNCEPVLISVC